MWEERKVSVSVVKNLPLVLFLALFIFPILICSVCFGICFTTDEIVLVIVLGFPTDHWWAEA